MKPTPSRRVRFAFIATAAFLLSHARVCAATATGTIEGRVLNVTTGAYLGNARVSVEGATLAAFTNNVGEYRLTGVPAGPATVQVFFTGLAPQTGTVEVTAGQVVTRDFSLAQMDTVKLDAFVVAAVKEANASALAINEQRFAPSIKNVVAADEFGTVTEGNVAEFLKFIPGVTLDYVAVLFERLSRGRSKSAPLP